MKYPLAKFNCIDKGCGYTVSDHKCPDCRHCPKCRMPMTMEYVKKDINNSNE